MQFWAANDTASSEGYSGDNGIRSWEMQPLQMKNKKRSERHEEVSPRKCLLSSMTEDIVSINSPKWNYICGTKNQPRSQIETGGNKQRLTIHFSENVPGNQRAATDSLSPPIHRTSQSLFPRKHYTSSPREEGGCQAIFLTTKSGGSKKGKLGGPKARYCGAAAKSLQSCPTLCDPIDGSPPGSRPWDSPGKNTGVGCHFLLQCMQVKHEGEVAQTLSDPMDCSPPGSSVNGIFQARVLGWVAIAFALWCSG